MNRGGPHKSLTDSFGLKWSHRTRETSCVTIGTSIGSSSAVQVGTYNDFEMVGEWSSPDAADATFRFWLNRNSLGTFTVQNHWDPDLVCVPPSFSPRVIPFHELAWTPVWGGKVATNTRKDQTDHIRLAYFYVSGEPF